MWINFEGGEGCGKTTQLRLLSQVLTAKNIPFHATREPGGTKEADIIRDVLLKGTVDKFEPMTELLLHYAARYEHMHRCVLPLLHQNIWILGDRGSDSSFAYQVCGQGIHRKKWEGLHTLLFPNNEATPDYTIILDCPVEVGLTRAHARKGDIPRYERMNSDFHQRVRDGFTFLYSLHPERYLLLDGTASQENIHAHIVAHFSSKGIF